MNKCTWYIPPSKTYFKLLPSLRWWWTNSGHYHYLSHLFLASRLKHTSAGVFGKYSASGQSSWLQIRRPGFDSRHYQKKK
jgi:hypothetical protein